MKNPETQSNSRKPRRIILYVMLLVSAAATLFLHDRLWAKVHQGELPSYAPLVPPALFTLFVVLYSIDRIVEMRRGRLRFGRAFFQVAFSVIFLMLLYAMGVGEP